eukprot:scaffold7368_cov114-Skeletonema_marinoi.AAC.3
MAVNRGTEELEAYSDASSGHLRRCSEADTSSGMPYSQREIRYGRQQRGLRLSQMPHQVTYDVVATPLRPKTHEP